MKFFTALSVVGLFSSAIASPVAVPVAVEKRQYDAQVSLLTDLYASIQGKTATINSTVSALGDAASDEDKAAAAATVNTAISEITTLITTAAANVGTASKARDVQARQVDVTALVGLIGQILSELSGALNLALAPLGLGALLGLGGLTSALSGLLLALEVVVNDLLAVVKQLLDGILTGLSLALAGLTL